MADKDNLGSFKAGDAQNRGVKSPQSNQDAADSESASAGFPAIEAILDKESPESLSARLTELAQALEEKEAEAKTPKDKAAAKRGLEALHLTAELLDYLFQTKEALQQEGPK